MEDPLVHCYCGKEAPIMKSWKRKIPIYEKETLNT